MRWVLFVLLATIYVGGIVGSFEFSKARFGCALLKDRRISSMGSPQAASARDVEKRRFGFPPGELREPPPGSHSASGSHRC